MPQRARFVSLCIQDVGDVRPEGGKEKPLQSYTYGTSLRRSRSSQRCWLGAAKASRIDGQLAL